MSLKLSPTLASYFVATNAHDVDAMIAGFAKVDPIESSLIGGKTIVRDANMISRLEIG